MSRVCVFGASEIKKKEVSFCNLHVPHTSPQQLLLLLFLILILILSSTHHLLFLLLRSRDPLILPIVASLDNNCVCGSALLALTLLTIRCLQCDQLSVGVVREGEKTVKREMICKKRDGRFSISIHSFYSFWFLASSSSAVAADLS